MSKPVTILNSVVSLDYERPPSLVIRDYAEAAGRKKLIAHRCPSCQRIYTPPRGYCPICTVPTGKEHEIELADRGFLVTFTVTHTKGEEHGDKAWANIWGTFMLDGTPIKITGGIEGIAPEDLRTGMRFRAIWADNFGVADMLSVRGWGTAGIEGWEPSGEPDVPMDEVQRLVSEATEQ